MNFSDTTILVVGDLMLDEYIVGKNYYMSSEAPVPVLKVDDFEVSLGGAANVAHNLQTLGCNVLLSGVIGCRDGRGTETGHLGQGHSAKRLMKLLDKNNLPSDLIIESDHRTTTKTRVLINGHQVARYDYEQIGINNHTKRQICDHLREIDYGKIDLIIISDYGKGVICKEVINLLRETSCRIVADPKPINKHLYHGFFCLTPNVSEFREMISNPSVDSLDIISSSKELIKRFNLDYLIVTLGVDGVFFCSPERSEFISGCKKEVINIIGAGDTFIAIFSAALAAGSSCLDAIRLANVGAGIVVSKQYTSVCSLDELKNTIGDI